MDIIYFATTDWRRIYQRPQHLARGLSRENRVLYINPPYSFIDIIVSALRMSDKKPEFRLRKSLVHINDNLWVLTPPILFPFSHASNSINRLNYGVIKRLVIKTTKELGFREPVLWTSFPTHNIVVGDFSEVLVVYDRMDEYSAFFKGRTRKMVRLMESHLLEKADIILVPSEGLISEGMKRDGRSHVVPNAFDPSHFRNQGQGHSTRLEGIPHPTIGFSGYIGKWVDLESVVEVALKNPNWSFVFIGPVHRSTKVCAGVSNIYFKGAVPYEEIPENIRKFDVCLIPQIPSGITENVIPLKFFEYLACVKPIISRKTFELSKYPQFISLYETPSELETQIRKALEGFEKTPEWEEKRQVFLEENKWEKRVDDIIGIMNEKIDHSAGC
ncbi:MAG: glycosyltransferase [Actinomycetota bacterium]|nr:glycosyltransferase [Actinomycetota bacterium]